MKPIYHIENAPEALKTALSLELTLDARMNTLNSIEVKRVSKANSVRSREE